MRYGECLFEKTIKGVYSSTSTCPLIILNTILLCLIKSNTFLTNQNDNYYLFNVQPEHLLIHFIS